MMGIAEFFKWLFEQFQDYILPFIIIPVYERGVRLRVGKNPTVLSAGWHWKIPFLDHVHTCIITIDTMATHAVHLTTKDNKTITVTPVIEFEIEDALKWIIYTNDAITNLHDLARGEVADYLSDTNWEDCTKKPTATAIKNKLANKVKDMGAKIHRVVLADIAVSKVFITQI